MEATRLAGFAAPLVDFALTGRRTRVLDLALDRSLEEGFAGFAGAQAIVLTTGYITTYKTGLLVSIQTGASDPSGACATVDTSTTAASLMMIISTYCVGLHNCTGGGIWIDDDGWERRGRGGG